MGPCGHAEPGCTCPGANEKPWERAGRLRSGAPLTPASVRSVLRGSPTPDPRHIVLRPAPSPRRCPPSPGWAAAHAVPPNPPGIPPPQERLVPAGQALLTPGLPAPLLQVRASAPGRAPSAPPPSAPPPSAVPAFPTLLSAPHLQPSKRWAPQWLRTPSSRPFGPPRTEQPQARGDLPPHPPPPQRPSCRDGETEGRLGMTPLVTFKRMILGLPGGSVG